MMEQIKPPPGEIVKSVMQTLESRGIMIPTEHVDMSIAAMCHWLNSGRRGHEYMAHVQQLDGVEGKNEKVYKLRDGFGRLTKEVEPESIIFLRGCLIDGESVPISSLDISDREREYCESCGGQVVCAQLIKTHHSESLETQCSHCMASGEDSNVRDKVKIDCGDCSYFACSWNPANEIMHPHNQAI